MKINEIKNQAVVLDATDQILVKGGTGDTSTTTSILIVDMDAM